MLSDASEGVRLAAVEYLCLHDPSKTAERIESMLGREDLTIRLSAARFAADQPAAVFRPSMELIRNLLAVDGGSSVPASAVAARLAAKLPSSDAVPLLRELLGDARPEVAAAAAQAIGAAGHLDLLFEVLPMLTRRDLRAAAGQALVSFGPRIIGTLGDVLCDPRRELALRREVPWVLGQLETARAANTLAENLDAEDHLLKYQVVKALNRMYERNPDLPVPRPRVVERIQAQVRNYYEMLAICQAVEAKAPEGQKSLLERAVRERLDHDLEIVFRLLALAHPPKDIYSAFCALRGPRADRRTSAIEFLDNLLQKNLKSIVLPLLEESSTERLLDRAPRMFGIRRFSREEALRAALLQPDLWLKNCALYEIGANRMTEFSGLCRELMNDREPLTRETAVWALKRYA